MKAHLDHRAQPNMVEYDRVVSRIEGTPSIFNINSAINVVDIVVDNPLERLALPME